MNNKQLGNNFEREFCEYLGRYGWWAHFMNPNRSGAQPFDIIAIRNSSVLALDCKTCSTDRFPFSRIEDNQRMAFHNLLWKTDAICGLIVLYDNEYYFINFVDIIHAEEIGEKSVKLTKEKLLHESLRVK